MIIFINNKSTKFCQITFYIKRFIHKRKVFLFFCLTVYKQNWLQLLFVVKATALNRQVSEFSPQFRST